MRGESDFKRLIDLIWLEVVLHEIVLRGQYSHQLSLRVAEIRLGFEPVRHDRPLIVDARRQPLSTNLALVLFVLIEQHLNLFTG